VPEKTKRHWDAIAALYLSPSVLRPMFEKNIYPAPVDLTPADLTKGQPGATHRPR
jgi:hypothetical protein